jgi:hypothetical protein
VLTDPDADRHVGTAHGLEQLATTSRAPIGMCIASCVAGPYMSGHKDTISAEERARRSNSVARGDTGGGNTPVPAVGDLRPPVLDPRNPASKPHGTTKDQISNMEGEGQAQTPGQEPPVDINEQPGKGPGKTKGPRRSR